MNPRPPLLLSPFVLAELDYLLSTRVSTAIARALLREVADGAYQLELFTLDDVAAAGAILDPTRIWPLVWPMPRSSSLPSVTTRATS
jgi:hypothetical protein